MTQHGDDVLRDRVAAPAARPPLPAEDDKDNVGPIVVLAVWKAHIGWQSGSVCLHDEMEAHDVASLLLDLEARVFFIETDPTRDVGTARVAAITEYQGDDAP